MWEKTNIKRNSENKQFFSPEQYGGETPPNTHTKTRTTAEQKQLLHCENRCVTKKKKLSRAKRELWSEKAFWSSNNFRGKKLSMAMQSCSFEIDANVSLNDAASKKLFIGSENTMTAKHSMSFKPV